MTIFPTKRGSGTSQVLRVTGLYYDQTCVPFAFGPFTGSQVFSKIRNGNSTSNDGFLLVKVLTSRDVWFLQLLVPGDSK